MHYHEFSHLKSSVIEVFICSVTALTQLYYLAGCIFFTLLSGIRLPIFG
ncbi:hypothetical protein PULV_a3130 [Pseudoalteromonas ulvae UL12]|nr:hypothetical protein [Pseudoalteromonas ulvae UL12]